MLLRVRTFCLSSLMFRCLSLNNASMCAIKAVEGKYCAALALVYVWTAIVSAASGSSASQRAAAGRREVLDSLAVPVAPAENREFSFTDKQSGYWYGRTHTNHNTDWFAGWNVATKRILHDYELLIDGVPLDRGTAKVEVFPYEVRRTFANATEELFLFDREEVVGIRLSNVKGTTCSIRIVGSLTSVEGATTEGLLLVPKDAPTHRVLLAPWLHAAVSATSDTISAPASCGGFALVYSGDGSEASALLARFRTSHDKWLAGRQQRMADLLTESNLLRTNDPDLDRALKWLMLTTDELVVNQQGWGIYAGLPWFNDYWGRDLFISLPGACLVTGQFYSARKILLSFAALQNTDPNSKNFGRVPNRARPDDIIYNTADGTPRFVSEIMDYARYSGDRSIFAELYPAVKRAAEGALKYWADANGYLTHDDADTWMDARENGKRPFSPRGNRANDIQALWFRQLDASANMAEAMHDDANAKKWRELSERMRARFPDDFLDATHAYMADRLTSAGERDFKLRPNQLFALDMVKDAEKRMQIARTVWEELVYPWGVASLAQRDPDFHPYHEDPRWHKDAAYHNGTVWLWNNGIAMQRLLEFGQADAAYELFENMNRQALHEGAVGSLSENADALPRPGQSRGKLSGTFLQAWSNAEHVRVWYQWFLGIRPDMLSNRVTVSPCLPSKLTDVEFAAQIGSGKLRAHYQNAETTGSYVLKLEDVALRVSFDLPDYEEIESELPVGGTLEIERSGDELRTKVVDASNRAIQQSTRKPSPERQKLRADRNAFFKDLHFAKP